LTTVTEIGGWAKLLNHHNGPRAEIQGFRVITFKSTLVQNAFILLKKNIFTSSHNFQFSNTCLSEVLINIYIIIKGEIAPHSFNEIQKHLNRSLLGSSIYICYKKAWISAPQVKYTPSIYMF